MYRTEDSLPCDNYLICISEVDDCESCLPNHFSFGVFFVGPDEGENDEEG